MQKFKQQWTLEALFVADAALFILATNFLEASELSKNHLLRGDKA